MHLVLAWFSRRPLSPEARGLFRARLEAAIGELVPEGYVRYEAGGDDWGVTMVHPGRLGSTRWEPVLSDERVTALSLGVPVGVARDDTTLTLGRRLLAGEEIHRTVIPPFGLIAVDAGGEMAVQQDWLGMCRLFTGQADGVTMLCSRPSLLAAVLRGTAEPDLAGWASYAVCGHFGGDFSPADGVRLLAAGERVTGRRAPDGGWTLTSRTGYDHDDVVLAGLAEQGRPLRDKLADAADALTAVADQITDRHEHLVLGLSGGRDSRLIAASLLAAGRLPRLTTNDDIVEEGDTARELVRLVRERRGLEVRHEVRPAAPPPDVFAVGLRERIERLQHRYDYQFPHNYTVRPAPGRLLPAAPAEASMTGAAGELATPFWYPRPDEAGLTASEVAIKHLLGPTTGLAGWTLEQERERVGAILRRAVDKGVHDEHVIDYLYLVQSLRRWLSSAYVLNMVTPLLHPSLVSAMFSLTPQQKRDRVLHEDLTRRLAPEWADVPYYSGGSPTSTVPKVWEGDGVEVLTDLLGTTHGRLVELVDTTMVEQMLTGERPMSAKALQRFGYLAVASHHLEPGTVTASAEETRQRLAATRRDLAASAERREAERLERAVAAQRRAAERQEAKRRKARREPVVRRLRWIKRTRPGLAAWNAARRLINPH